MKIFKTAYNKQTIMYTAHKFYRDGRFGSWTNCLRMAWLRARIIKSALDGIGREAKTYSGWKEAGFEVIHGQRTVKQCVVPSVRYKNQDNEILSFFVKRQVCVLGTQLPKTK